MSRAYLVSVCAADERDELGPKVGAEVDDVGVWVALGSDSTDNSRLWVLAQKIITFKSAHCRS